MRIRLLLRDIFALAVGQKALIAVLVLKTGSIWRLGLAGKADILQPASSLPIGVTSALLPRSDRQYSRKFLPETHYGTPATFSFPTRLAFAIVPQ